MKKLTILLFLSVFVFQFVKAEKFNPDSAIVIAAYAQSYYSIYDSISNNCEEHYSSVKIPKGSLVVLVGYKQCKKSEYSLRTSYYEIIYKGKVYFVKENDLHFVDDVNYIDLLSSISEEEYDKFRTNGILAGLYLRKNEIQGLYDYFQLTESKGLSILRWNVFDVSEYTDGTGVDFTVYNPTKKTIKYVTFVVRGYNAVDDPVRAKDGNYSFTLRGIGPIESGESATYSWDYIWFTDIVETVKISSVKVQYMDNTIKTITNVEQIIMDEKQQQTYYSLE